MRGSGGYIGSGPQWVGFILAVDSSGVGLSYIGGGLQWGDKVI